MKKLQELSFSKNSIAKSLLPGQIFGKNFLFIRSVKVTNLVKLSGICTNNSTQPILTYIRWYSYPYRNKDFTLGNPNSIYNTIGSQIATNLQMTFVLSTLVFSKRT